MSQVTLGGDRLGSGNNMKVDLKTFNRSTHDLSYVWRSTMSPGTLVPFMSELLLPGDTFTINLDADSLTHPTLGPLFGSFKLQVDVFKVPIRLYQGDLHMNRLNIGMKMKDVKLPQILIEARNITEIDNIDNQQINPSSIFAHLNIRGLGATDIEASMLGRLFNAVPYLAYWDIYKNYYANKQEEIGAVIHNPMYGENEVIDYMEINVGQLTEEIYEYNSSNVPLVFNQGNNVDLNITMSGYDNTLDFNNIYIAMTEGDLMTNTIWRATWYPITSLFNNIVWNQQTSTIICSGWIYENPKYQSYRDGSRQQIGVWQQFGIVGFRFDREPKVVENIEPIITTFPLENIDEMREKILKNVGGTGLIIKETEIEPYSLPMYRRTIKGKVRFSQESKQEGLALKTYQSDLFNNWISTEWIDGESGVNEITKIITSDGGFTIDTLNLSNKIYEMLNQIAVSGGTYKDWIKAVYAQDKYTTIEEPMYVGGLSKEIVFEEVISNSNTETGTLGELAGRGRIGKKKKGGFVKVSADEPSYLMGIVSITPRVTYSQGNKWDTLLRTMDDFHKPHLDQIGFQDLITDQMAFFDTYQVTTVPEFKSAGKQPAWINYMTNVDVSRGNFAIIDEQMYMTLNRRYEVEFDDVRKPRIKDLTTYIDPAKFNYIFADVRRDAQNFWVQINCDIRARRKMSAKVIPNL